MHKLNQIINQINNNLSQSYIDEFLLLTEKENKNCQTKIDFLKIKISLINLEIFDLKKNIKTLKNKKISELYSKKTLYESKILEYLNNINLKNWIIKHFNLIKIKEENHD